jgi:succinate-acetate transporter protein
VTWIRELLAGTDGRASTKRFAFFAFVIAGALWLSYDLVLSMSSLKKSGITETWVMAFGIYASACTGGYVMGKREETKMLQSLGPTKPEGTDEAGT